jgi:hypothetical protein
MRALQYCSPLFSFLQLIEGRWLVRLFFLCFLLTGGTASSQQIFINEFLASNSVTLADEAGGFDDWVELYNPGPAPVNIAGMYLTDDLTKPALWKIPATDPAITTIQPGGFLLLWFDKEMAQGVLHIDAKLGADGEDIGLFAADGLTLIDGLTYGPQTADVSYGRIPDGGSGFQFFTTPSPKATNFTTPAGDYAATPAASVEGGFFSTPLQVILTTTTTGAEIRYTLDGSIPDASSPVYIAPLQINYTKTLRARAFAAGLLPSSAITHTYLFDANHTFPVVALSFNEADFFSPQTGIYPNYWQDWKRPVYVEFFDDDGMPGFNQEGTAEIHGTGSADYPQKSLKVEAKADGGSGFFQYPIFPELPFEKYKTFLLRNSGQDWNTTMFRDAFVTSLVGDLSDVGDLVEKPNLYLQAFRPGVLYLNGKYWGIHNLREHLTENYIEQHFGLKDNEIDLLDNDNEARTGDFNRWNFLIQYLSSNRFGRDAQLQELGSFIDLPNFLDYQVFNILVDNADWPGNNNRRWRERVNDAQWRFLTFDLDLSFGLLKHEADTMRWNTGDASANSLARALDSTSILWPNPLWTTLPFRRAMDNASFRRDFINRTADFLNVLFNPQRVSARIDEFQALYQPEIQRHFDRWSPGWNPWLENVQVLRQFGKERPKHLKKHFVDYFNEIKGTADITLKVQPAGAGKLVFSTIHLDDAHLPWTGEYFTGIDIPVKAIPAPGYVFSGWSSPGMGSNASSKINLAGETTLIAYFTQGSTAKDVIVINEINYNSSDLANSGDWVELFNPNNHSVDISGWLLKDESNGYFSIPSGTVMAPGSFLVVVENGTDFSLVHPQAQKQVGDFGEGTDGFKLSNNSELIQLVNAKLEVIDSVRYDDELPWPPAADGTGSSLQLIRWQLDNALPSSWMANTPTPGLPNVAAPQSQVINFLSINNKVSTSPPFSITATASSGLPVIFSIVSGPATVNGSIVTLTGNEGLVTIKASQPGNSSWQLAPDVFQTFQVKKLISHCESKAARPWWEWIERVQFGQIDHLSFKTPYGNFTSVITEAPLGEMMTLTITPAFSWEVFREYFRAWIDFNRDGDFEDVGEKVLEAQSSSAVSMDVLIPADAVVGPTRLRVAMQRSKFPEPCEQFDLGEVQDYVVFLTQENNLSPDDEGDDSTSYLKVWPNPVQSNLAAQFFTKKSGPVLLSVVGAQGGVILKEQYNLQEGDHYIEVDVSTLPAGLYHLFLLPEKQKPLSKGFVKPE